MYVPTLWEDEVVEYPYRYKETQNDDGSIEHVPDPGEIFSQGTPQSATNFNHLERFGTFMAIEMANETLRMLMSTRRELEGIVGEKLEVTLTNSQDYPFNNSVKSVQLPESRNNKDYTIEAEVVSRTGGSVGEIVFSDKLLNGFKVAYTGSASQVVLNLYVRGGI